MNDGECKQCDNGNNLEKNLCLCLVVSLVEMHLYSIRDRSLFLAREGGRHHGGVPKCCPPKEGS